MWQPPSLTLKWGPYSKATPEEQKQTVDMVVAAISAAQPLITLRMAVEKLRQGGVFEIDNVGAVIEELEAKAEENKAKEEETKDLDQGRTLEQIETKAKAMPPKAPFKK